MDDKIVIKNILSGKIDDYGLLMKKYNYEIFSYVFNMVGTYHVTEDIVQEIFIKAYNHLSSYNPNKARFRTWLYKIAANHTVNVLKKKAKIVLLLDESYQEIEAEIDLYEDIIKEEQVAIIIRTMTRILKPKPLAILQLHFFSDLSTQEISDALNVPLKSVYRIISSSIEKVQKEVNSDE